MKSLFIICNRFALTTCLALSFTAHSTQAADTESTTVIMFRHGEKPVEGLGMLSCKGLNRSLALPSALFSSYGRPDVAIAPNPGIVKNDNGTDYNYNRPLLTIAPTAIASGIPISTTIGWSDHQGLANALLGPALKGKTVFVAWEHHLALQTVRDIFADTESKQALPDHWADDDFDTVYVIKIDRNANSAHASLTIEAEGLNSVKADCPHAAAPLLPKTKPQSAPGSH